MNASVIRAIDLLEVLAKEKKPTPLKDLAAAAKLDKATAYRLLSSLLKRGLVHKPGDGGLYSLGPAFLLFAEAFRKSLAIREKVLPHLRGLVEDTEETAIYCERFQRDSCVTVERWDSPHQTRTFSETGLPRPLSVGSSGQAILAMLPESEIVAIISGKPPLRYTPFTPTSRGRLLKKIEETRRRGYSVSIQERNLYTAGIAAPVFNDRSVLGSLSVIGPAERIKQNGIETIGRSVLKTARKLSMELGFREENAQLFAGNFRSDLRLNRVARKVSSDFRTRG